MNTSPAFRTAIVLALACALPCAASARSYVYLYGDPAPDTAAGRTIVITPETRHINAEGGEVIRFIVGDRSFAWTFNVARTVNAFDLNEVAPPGLLDHKVRAYVSPDPKYLMP
ncbi:hypothetical protein EGT07_04835 [Herbaspirillum sp. HC18]|nr:hypothetical protein EGT07_04835 [Herbaspirillum sp. HC18]